MNKIKNLFKAFSQRVKHLQLCDNHKILNKLYMSLNPGWDIAQDHVKLENGEYPPCKCCLFYRGVWVGIFLVILLKFIEVVL